MTLKSFRIEGFDKPASDAKQSPKFEEFYKNKVKEVQAMLDNSVPHIKPNNAANLLESLIKSKNDYSDYKEMTKTAPALDTPTVLFAILNKINYGNKLADT